MIKVRIITPDGIYKDLQTPIINITSVDGERGILENHMPVVFMLDIGKLETEENGVRCLYAISGGMFYFENNEASILVSAIEAKNDIDKQRALDSMQRQEEKLKEKNPNMDMKRAEISLRRALNRIKIAG